MDQELAIGHDQDMDQELLLQWDPLYADTAAGGTGGSGEVEATAGFDKQAWDACPKRGVWLLLRTAEWTQRSKLANFWGDARGSRRQS
eukprot:1146667-Pelagomonas_calceolata.AAC.5